jgi:hypothetical protein
MHQDEPNLTDPRLLRAGAAVARLSRPDAPAGLAARTLARISEQYQPIKRVFWMIRPITHPVARIAAAALIIYALAPMTDLDIASRLGVQIEQHVLGASLENHVEALVDNVLIRQEIRPTEAQPYLDSFMGVPSIPTSNNPRRPAPHAHTRTGT